MRSLALGKRGGRAQSRLQGWPFHRTCGTGEGRPRRAQGAAGSVSAGGTPAPSGSKDASLPVGLRGRQAKSDRELHPPAEPPEARVAEGQGQSPTGGMDGSAQAEPFRPGEVFRPEPPPHAEELNLCHDRTRKPRSARLAIRVMCTDSGIHSDTPRRREITGSRSRSILRADVMR
jgi:hypothetical protein